MDDADVVLDADDVNNELQSRCAVWWDWPREVVGGATDVAEGELVAVWEADDGT